MKTIGIGVDIVQNIRIYKSIQNKKFISRIFGKKEIFISKKTFDKTKFFSKRFAAKEAFVKALGTGLARGVFWKDIEVKNNQYGKPLIKLHGKAKEIFKNMNKTSDTHIEVSLSDEKKYAIANVTIYD